MKNIQLVATLSLTMVFCSCSGTLSPELTSLLGNWRSEKIYVNDQLQEEQVNEGVLLGFWLNDEKEQMYYRVFESGDFSLQGDQLTFTPNPDLRILTRRYTLLELSGDRLVLQVSGTRKELGWNLDGTSPEEVVVVREEYRREEM